MNHQNHYTKLIDRARLRILDQYTELHHIIPRCMGGTDDLTNLVRLTPEEHFLAHLLLVKIHPTNQSLIYAALMMRKNGAKNNKTYGWLRKRLSALGLSESHKKAISSSMKGKKKSPEHREAMSKAHRERNGETLEAMQERWKREELKRQHKKDQAIITAVIYSVT